MKIKKSFVFFSLLIILIIGISGGSAFAQSRGTWIDYSKTVLNRESSGNWSATNQYGYLGGYQMGAAALTDAGYVRPGTTQAGLSNPANWTGKNGINSSSDYLNNPAVQQSAWEGFQAGNWNTMSRMGLTQYSGQTMADGTVITDSGLLMASQFGVKRLQNYLKNGGTCDSSTVDGNGVCVSEYLKKGAGYDVSSVTKNAENLANFKPQESNTAASDGSASQAVSDGAGASASGSELDCWACKLLPPIVKAVDAVANSASKTADKYGVLISSIFLAFGILFYVAKCYLPLLGDAGSSFKGFIRFVLIATVVITVYSVSASNWLWVNAVKPGVSAVFVIGGELTADLQNAAAGSSGSGSSATNCGNQSGGGSAPSALSIQDEPNGYSGLIQPGQGWDTNVSGGGSSNTPSMSASDSGAVSELTQSMSCTVKATTQTGDGIMSNLWGAYQTNPKTGWGVSGWISGLNLPLLIQIITIIPVIFIYDLMVAIIAIMSAVEIGVGVTLLPFGLFMLMFQRTSGFFWECLKLVIKPALTIVLMNVAAGIIVAALNQVLQSYGISSAKANMLNNGVVPLGLWAAIIGAFAIGSFLIRKAESWAGTVTMWLGMGGGGPLSGGAHWIGGWAGKGLKAGGGAAASGAAALGGKALGGLLGIMKGVK